MMVALAFPQLLLVSIFICDPMIEYHFQGLGAPVYNTYYLRPPGASFRDRVVSFNWSAAASYVLMEDFFSIMYRSFGSDILIGNFDLPSDHSEAYTAVHQQHVVLETPVFIQVHSPDRASVFPSVDKSAWASESCGRK